MSRLPRELWIYLVVAFVLGFAAQAQAIRMGLAGGGRVWLLATMWTPAVAVLSASSRARALVRRSLHARGLRYVPLAIAVGCSQILLARLLLLVTGRYAWDNVHFPLAAGGGGVTGIHGLATVLGPQPQAFAFLALNIVLSVALASITNGIVGGLGEELGWRVFLQPSLETRHGPIRGTIWVGLIWAAWHLPANLAGYNDDVHPVLSALVLFPIGVIALAFAFAWLYHYSGGSVWAVAVAHGANNTLASAFVINATDWASDQAASLAASVILAVVFAFGMMRRRGGARQSAQG